MQILITLLYILFVLAAIVLVVVILLQEGKGGGLTDALGTSGQQAIGVAASGIHKFTGWTAGVFLVSAFAIHILNRIEGNASAAGEFGLPAEVSPAPAGGAQEQAPPSSTPAPTPAPATPDK